MYLLKKMGLTFWGPSWAQGRRLARRLYLVRSFPTRQNSVSLSSLDRRAGRRNDSIVRRHASIALAPSASVLGELREGTQGGYEGAIPALKLVQMDRGNRSFAEGGSMTHPCIKRMRSTGTHGLLGHFCKEIGKLLH